MKTYFLATGSGTARPKQLSGRPGSLPGVPTHYPYSAHILQNTIR